MMARAHIRFRNAVRTGLLAATVVFAGCGDDLVAVNGRLVDPAPEVSAFRDMVGDDALTTIYILDQLPDGPFEYTLADGSTLSGTLDRNTGEFDVLQELPTGYYLVSVRDRGRLDFDGSGTIRGASYRETQEFISGTNTELSIEVEVGSSRLSIDAVDLSRGTRIESLVTHEGGVGLNVSERWHLADTFVEEIDAIYFDSGPKYLDQSWVRDDLATQVAPDRTGDFTLFRDGSGSGELVNYYDHDISAVYLVTLETNGSQRSTLIYEDPATAVSPDGQGVYNFNPDYSGNGFYTESYDDGSLLRSDYLFQYDGSTDELFRFDDASTAFTTDADGEIHYAPDGSGSGVWRRYDAAGVVEECAYSFDSAGNVVNLFCE